VSVVIRCQASNDSSEPASAGVASAAASDLSWEQVEERDSRMTLWVPDHVVTHCTGCHQEFWMVRRKHHCRSVSPSPVLLSTDDFIVVVTVMGFFFI